MKSKALMITLALVATGCRFIPGEGSAIKSINIIDRAGLSEIISSKERLESFAKTDFLSPQPYQKIMRVYGRDKQGDIRSYITSYHPNGQVKQYLEAKNNRAMGLYQEWFQNGQMKIDTHVIGGVADINTSAEESFVFNGLTRAWNEEGQLVAEILYEKGELEGLSSYYHPNGALWKMIPYKKGLIDGTVEVYLEEGTIFQTTEYKKGKIEGSSKRYWAPLQIAYEECYSSDLLLEGYYYDKEGDLVSRIEKGEGKRAVFGKQGITQLVEYHAGIADGKVEILDETTGQLLLFYSIKEEEKEGEEIAYFGNGRPKLLLTWKEGVLQGPAKTWYENGQIESQKQMCQNKKNGLSTAWYPGGTLMLVEEYENDRLIKGKYYRQDENVPISTISKGEGVATLFDTSGHLIRKITYCDGEPQK
ncbi:MAG: hypothetical protein KDK55_01730 [Chlamydiia bacterium]|nr:hypothetical protein [Chlamydiia bacterium]